jgi:hypothetical protein
LGRRRILRAIGALLAVALVWLPALPARVQPLPASLVADNVTFDRATGLLVATGNVEVLYGDRVLRASRITYDQEADEVRAEGPIVLTDPAGGVLLADSAALSPDLQAGLVAGARVLIANQLQLAAFYAGDLQAKLRGADRGDIAAGAGADHQDVEIIVSHSHLVPRRRPGSSLKQKSARSAAWAPAFAGDQGKAGHLGSDCDNDQHRGCAYCRGLRVAPPDWRYAT